MATSLNWVTSSTTITSGIQIYNGTAGTTATCDNFIWPYYPTTTLTSATAWSSTDYYFSHMYSMATGFNQAGVFNQAGSNITITVGSCVTETPEQRAHREVQMQRWQAEQRLQEAKRTAAEVKAEQLFIDIFGEIAHRRFKQLGYHEMHGPSGTTYRMRPGQRIEVVKNGKTDHRLCVVHPVGSDLPAMDTMIAQALMLSTGDEGEKELEKVGIRWAA